MSSLIFRLAAAIAVAPLFMATASAEFCMSHAKLMDVLLKRFGESPAAVGLVEDRAVMEFFISARGTWSVVMSSPQGVACIVAAGDALELLPQSRRDEY